MHACIYLVLNDVVLWATSSLHLSAPASAVHYHNMAKWVRGEGGMKGCNVMSRRLMELRLRASSSATDAHRGLGNCAFSVRNIDFAKLVFMYIER